MSFVSARYTWTKTALCLIADSTHVEPTGTLVATQSGTSGTLVATQSGTSGTLVTPQSGTSDHENGIMLMIIFTNWNDLMSNARIEC